MIYLCNMCGAEFEFTLSKTPLAFSTAVTKIEPRFCPDCGRENNINAERRTHFKKIELLKEEEIEEEEKDNGSNS